MKRYLYILISALLLIASLVLISCGSSEEEAVNSQDASISVDTEVVERVTAEQLVTYSGVVQNASRVQIATKVLGEIEAIPFDIGESFKKGQVILRIKQDQVLAQKEQAEAALAEAEIGLVQAKKDYERFKNLYESESASLREWENAQNGFAAAESRVARASAAIKEVNDVLSYTTVRAQFSGVVASTMMEVGDLSAPGRPILEIEKNDSYTLEFSMPESSVSLISLGDSIGVQIPALAGLSLNAKVSNVSQSGNRMNRQFEVEADLDLNEEASAIRSGMFADVLIPEPSNPALFISKASIVERGQLSGVYVVNQDNQILLRWVSLGKQKDDKIEVLSGLQEGETIVSNPLPTLRDGVTVANR